MKKLIRMTGVVGFLIVALFTGPGAPASAQGIDPLEVPARDGGTVVASDLLPVSAPAVITDASPGAVPPSGSPPLTGTEMFGLVLAGSGLVLAGSMIFIGRRDPLEVPI